MKRTPFFCIGGLVGLFLLFSEAKAQSYRQQSFQVRDSLTQQAIANAYVGFDNKPQGSLSNTSGEIQFSYPKILSNQTLKITALGYKNFYKIASEMDSLKQIDLLKAPIVVLDEDFIKKFQAKQFVEDALADRTAHYAETPNLVTGFYQESVQLDSTFHRISEAIVRIERLDNNETSDRIKALKSRTLEAEQQVKKAKDFGFPNSASVMGKSLENSLPLYLENRHLSEYSFKLDSVLSFFDDKPLFEIHFKPKNNKVKAARTGSMLIDTTSHALVQIRYEFTPEGLKDVLKNTAEKHTKNLSFESRYRTVKGKWSLQHTHLHLVGELTEMGPEKKNCAVDFTIRYVTTDVHRADGQSIQDTESLVSTDKFPKSQQYQDAFWQNYNFVKPTELMRTIANKRTEIQ